MVIVSSMAFGSTNISSEKNCNSMGMKKVYLFNNVVGFKNMAKNMDNNGGTRFCIQIHYYH